METEEKVNVEKEIGKELLEIQKEYSDGVKDKNHFIKRGLLTSKCVTKHRILFLGLNPSYQNDKKNKDLKECVNYIEEINQFGNEYPKYYNKFRDISKSLGTEWTHFDLLYCRETSQKVVENFDKDNDNFIKTQLELSKKIILLSNPKIIVVTNALARKKFIEMFSIKDDDFKEQIGTYRLKELDNVPVFFSGMLSGARGLDNGSFKRLEWHIKFVLEKLKDAQA